MTTSRPRAPMTTLFAATLCASLLLVASGAEAAKLYRWTDAEGNVHYSDRVPPEHVDNAHDRLNTQGMAVEHRDRAKTAEEVAREQELARLRAEQQRILEEQRARDEVLLKTFRSEEDLELARQGKLAAVDSQIRLAQSNVQRLKTNLAEMQARAAEAERKGGRINAKLQANIDDTRSQIERNYSYIVAREQEKQGINALFDRDLGRFRTLHALQSGAPTTIEPEAPAKPASYVDELVSCVDDTQCARFWARAKQYANAHATTQLQVNGDRIYMFAAPARDDDLSLTVSRIAAKDGSQSIFLDLQCRKTTYGQEFCASEAVRQIRRDFRSAVQPAE